MSALPRVDSAFTLSQHFLHGGFNHPGESTGSLQLSNISRGTLKE